MRKLKADKRRHEERKSSANNGAGNGSRPNDQARPNYNNPRAVIAQSGPIAVGKANFAEATPKESIRPAPALLAPGEATNKKAAEALKQRLKRKLHPVKDEVARAAAAVADAAVAAGTLLLFDMAGAVRSEACCCGHRWCCCGHRCCCCRHWYTAALVWRCCCT